MWGIDNATPFAHHGGFMRDHKAQTLWMVHVKATFLMRRDRPCLFAAEQVPLHIGPVFADADMLVDTDITPAKPRVDILVDATAYPESDGEPVPYVATASLGGWQKRVQVNPPAVFTRWTGSSHDQAASAGPVPLRYSHTIGGPEWSENPIGAGYVQRRHEARGAPVPRLSPPDAPHGNPARPVSATAFTAIPRGWAVRAALAGTYDEAWMRRRAPLYPADLDPAYWQAAPADQQVAADAVMGQVLTLAHMVSADGHTAEPPLSVEVPTLDLEIETRFAGRWTAQPATLQTLEIKAAPRTLSLTFAAPLPIGAAHRDVQVERAFIGLRDHGGFLVASNDVHRFNSPRADAPMTEEVA